MFSCYQTSSDAETCSVTPHLNKQDCIIDLEAFPLKLVLYVPAVAAPAYMSTH